MKIVTYRISLLEPTLVTALEGDPNSAVSHDYLPGSVLRGTFIGLMMRKHKLKELDINDAAVRRRFFDNSTRFLNGYLVVKGRRSLPAPRSWGKNKYNESGADKNEITDRVFMDDPGSTNGKLTNEQDKNDRPKTKNLGGKFVVYTDAGKVMVVELQHVINIHTDRDRKRGRSAGKGEGTIYRYDALEAGQTFEAQILCDTDADADFFKNLLEEVRTVVIGGARTAGYGRVQIHDVKIGDSAREVGSTLSQVSDTLVITLLSDVILRDANGQYAPDAPTLRATLAHKLGPDVELATKAVFKAESTLGGFNRKWGLPLPQMQALAMGSVFVIDISKLSDEAKQNLAQKLSALEEQGIGEHRQEGFGRIALNWQQPQELRAVEIKDTENSSLTAVLLSPDSESGKLWQRMESRLERQKVDRAQLEMANGLSFANLPPPSQLNRLREVVTTALLETTPSTDKIEDFFKSSIKGKRAEKYFEKATVSDTSMKDWVLSQAQNTDKYAALRLINGVLARAVKEPSEGGKNGEGK